MKSRSSRLLGFALQTSAVLLCGAWCPREALALDPSKAITQYIHEIWDSGKGLPKDMVRTVTQTRDGYIWLGTPAGAVRFDGVKFTVLDINQTKDSQVQALVEDRDGNLWIGTSAGLIQWRDGESRTFTKHDGLSSDHVSSLSEAADGSLWVGTERGLNRFKDGSFTTYAKKDGLSSDIVNCLYGDRDESLWVGTEHGLNRLKDGKVTVYTRKDGLSNNKVNCVLKDQEGNLWVGTDGGGLNRRKENGKWTAFSTREGLASDYVLNLYEDREGGLWIATWGGGLNRWKEGKFASYTTDQGLSSAIVTSVHEDREGSLWIGTAGGGLNRLRDAKLTTFTTREGLSNDRVTALVEDGAGNLWIGTEGGGLNRWKDGKWAAFTRRDGLSSDQVTALTQDREGSLWVGTEGGGVNRWKNGKWTIYTDKAGLSKSRVTVLYVDQKELVWIGTNAGLYVLKHGKLNRYDLKEGLSPHFVTSIYEDKEGTLWIGAEDGVIKRLRTGRSASYTAQDGLSYITSISEDLAGGFWIGTWNGLTRLKDGKWTKYTTREGLFDNAVLQILGDGTGHFWVRGNNGIFRVNQKELDDFAAGQIRSVASVVYDKADGLRVSQGTYWSQPGACRTRNGKLWFATSKGVVMIDPDGLKTNQFPPPVIIEHVRIDKAKIDPRRSPRLRPGQGELEFQYTGLSFLVPERVRFKYKLEGFDEEWIDAGTRRVAYYTNISPGSYRFRVIACNNDGVWNESGAFFSFYLTPHFYQTYWFYTICLVAIGALGATGHRLRVRQMRRRERELMVLVDERTQELQREIAKRMQAEQALRNACDDLELRVEERTAQLSQLSGRLLHLQDEERRRIARELHDSTGQSLITLVMNLAQLDRLAGTMDPAARQALSESRALAKECSNEIRTLSYLLHPPMLDQVGLARFLPWYADGFTERSGIQVHVNIPLDLGRLPPEVEMALFRVVQESLTNIQLHSASPTASIRLFREPAEVVTMEISDQGRGIPSKTLMDLSSKEGTGTGLGVGIAGMRERLKQLGGRLEITSGEQGTTVRAILALPKQVETSEKSDGDGSHSSSG